MKKRPNGPRNLKAGGFTNGLWRLEEREMNYRKQFNERKLTSAEEYIRRAKEASENGEHETARFLREMAQHQLDMMMTEEE
jgi:hypothetical protein